MGVPRSKEDVTLSWLQTVFRAHQLRVLSFQWEGDASNGTGALSALDRMTLKVQCMGKSSTKGENNGSPERLSEQEAYQMSVIFKTLPSEPLTRQFSVNYGFAKKELMMYTDLFPKWEKFLDSSNVSPRYRFRYPRCFYGEYEGSGANYCQVLILEDLLASGYKSWAEGYKKALGLTDAEPIVKLLARFHAIGVAYKYSQSLCNYVSICPELDESGLLEIMPTFFHNGFSFIKKLIAQFAEPEQVLKVPAGFLEQLSCLEKHAIYNLQFLAVGANELECLVHNDVHINNFMMCEEGTQIALYDFQACQSGNPMKDLSFFLQQNCELELIQDKLPTVLRSYHEEFEVTMKGILQGEWRQQSHSYPYEQMRRDFDKRAYLSAMHIISGAAHWCGDQTSNNASRLKFIHVLIHLYNNGLLNCATPPSISNDNEVVGLNDSLGSTSTTTTSISTTTGFTNKSGEMELERQL